MNNFKAVVATAISIATIATIPQAQAQSETVNIYSYRQAYLIEPFLEKFEAETGIKPVVLFADNGLIERAASEGENSPMDVLLTVDIGNLAAAKEAGIYQPLGVDSVNTRVPAALRDGDDAWTALSLRARVFYASNDRVPETNLTYEEIASDAWKDRLCMRSGQHVYNIGVIAAYIAHNGMDDARTWLTGVRDNLVGQPTGNDRAQVKSVYSGACDLAVGNTYYMGLMENNDEEPEQKEWAKSAHIIFPTYKSGGTHVNVSGALIGKYAPNAENARKLIDYLLSDEGQTLYAQTNYEYPVVPEVAPSDTVAAWGVLTPDTLPLTEIAAHRADASRLVDELQFNNGPQN